MAAKLSDNHRLTISKSDAKTINNFRLGAVLVRETGCEIDALLEIAVKDRLEFARRTLKYAGIAIAMREPQNRIAVARAYYGFYHAVRAVVFFSERGDDHQDHQTLPKHIPQDFPQRNEWENDLKAARLERNKADYDPYPKSEKRFSDAAQSTIANARKFLRVSKAYLVKKGCHL